MTTTGAMDHAMQLRDVDRRFTAHRTSLGDLFKRYEKVIDRYNWEIEKIDQFETAAEEFRKQGREIPEEVQTLYKQFKQNKYPMEKYRDAVKELTTELTHAYRASISISNILNRLTKDSMIEAEKDAKEMGRVESQNPFIQGLEGTTSKVSPERAEEMETERNIQEHISNAKLQADVVGPAF